MYIEKIDLTFFSDECNKFNNFHGNSNSTQYAGSYGNNYIQDSKSKSMSAEFEFAPGEFLVGDILINPNKN